MKSFMILNNIKNFIDIVRREKYEVLCPSQWKFHEEFHSIKYYQFC